MDMQTRYIIQTQQQWTKPNDVWPLYYYYIMFEWFQPTIEINIQLVSQLINPTGGLGSLKPGL